MRSRAGNTNTPAILSRVSTWTTCPDPQNSDVMVDYLWAIRFGCRICELCDPNTFAFA
jgi:hypothetical protein